MDTDQNTAQPVNPAKHVTEVQAPVKSSLNLMLVIPLILIVVAIAAGAVWFMNNERTSKSVESKSPLSPQAQTASSGLEGELNAIDIEENDPDFVDVDRDIKNL